MIVHQAYRFALDPSASQRRALAGHCGAARFAFNWGVAEVSAALALRAFEAAMGLTRTDTPAWNLAALRREWNQQKDIVAPWWPENSKEAYNSGFDALVRALRAWSQSRRGERAGATVGFPRFRKRGARDSCRFTTGALRVEDERHVILPRIGRLRTCEATSALRDRVSCGRARILSATVSREADRWFCSFTCAVERAVATGNGHSDTAGVDLGVLSLATVSTGEMVVGPRALRCSLRRLRRAQRMVSRRRKGSARRRKAVARLARVHRRVASVRRDHLHKLTTRLAKSHGRIVIENLNVRGMVRSARGTVDSPGRNVRAKSGLNRSLVDSSFGEFRRMLEYKCTWYGSDLAVADRFFASSKRCWACGVVRDTLRLAERMFRCPACGLVCDRDLNAARNLVWWAQARDDVAGSAPETQNARGEDERSEVLGDVLAHRPERWSHSCGTHSCIMNVNGCVNNPSATKP